MTMTRPLVAEMANMVTIWYMRLLGYRGDLQDHIGPTGTARMMRALLEVFQEPGRVGMLTLYICDGGRVLEAERRGRRGADRIGNPRETVVESQLGNGNADGFVLVDAPVAELEVCATRVLGTVFVLALVKLCSSSYHHAAGSQRVRLA